MDIFHALCAILFWKIIHVVGLKEEIMSKIVNQINPSAIVQLDNYIGHSLDEFAEEFFVQEIFEIDEAKSVLSQPLLRSGTALIQVSYRNTEDVDAIIKSSSQNNLIHNVWILNGLTSSTATEMFLRMSQSETFKGFSPLIKMFYIDNESMITQVIGNGYDTPNYKVALRMLC